MIYSLVSGEGIIKFSGVCRVSERNTDISQGQLGAGQVVPCHAQGGGDRGPAATIDKEWMLFCCRNSHL